jgi:hypothetical protein
MLHLSNATYRLRGIVAHQRLQAGGVSAEGHHAVRYSNTRFSHPVASVVVSGQAGQPAPAGTATIDQGHYIALVRERDSNAAVLYSDSACSFFSHEQDAMTSPLQAFITFYEQVHA